MFNDRFGITRFNFNENSTLSLSIDYFDDVVPVLLLIPDREKKDHDHIFLDEKSIIEFEKSLLKNHIFRVDRNTIKTSKTPNGNISLELFEHVKTSKNYLYKINIQKESIPSILDWIKHFKKLNQNELFQKYTDDRKKR